MTYFELVPVLVLAYPGSPNATNSLIIYLIIIIGMYCRLSVLGLEVPVSIRCHNGWMAQIQIQQSAYTAPNIVGGKRVILGM
jgi:hypothetical protein